MGVRLANLQPLLPLVTRKIRPYALLNDAALATVEEQARLDIAEHWCGVSGRSSRAGNVCCCGRERPGAKGNLKPGLARELCSTAPSEFKLHSRDPTNTVTLGGDNVVLMPGYGSPFVSDLKKGRRKATLKDFQNFVKLTYSTPWLHHSGGTLCEPTDVP